MTSALRATVVVPVRDGAATISRTLAALRSQSVSADTYEVIVVDNGSRDATCAIARDTGVRLVEASTPGPSAARNVGLAAAVAPIVAYVDADIVPTRRWLDALLAPFDDTHVGVVGGRTLSLKPTTTAEHYVAQSGRFEPHNNVLRETFPFAPSQNLAVRRSLAIAVGGWSEELTTAEDVDFCYRCTRSDHRLAYAPQAVVLHHERSSASALRRQAFSYGRGAAEMYLRYPEVVDWSPRRTIHVGRVLASRSLDALIWQFRPAHDDAARRRRAFAAYHSLWAWAWWSGFFRGYLAAMLRP